MTYPDACDTCLHTTWLTDSSVCVCLCHMESSSEDPPLPSASTEWVEFRKTVYETKPGRVRMTEEEKMARRKEYYKRTKDKISARHKEYYNKNRDKTLTLNKAYHEANKDKIRAQHKEYRKVNKDKISARRKEYYKKNKDRILAYNKRYRDEASSSNS